MDGQVIEIWGDGSVVRDYIYVGDVITAMLRAGECERSDTYNIGSGVGHSLNQILDIVRKLTGCKVNVRYLPSREFDVKRTFLDISKVARELDWRPSLTLEDGCAQYWSVITSNEKHQDLWSD
jgi:UDP-glucose 4-epimerase